MAETLTDPLAREVLRVLAEARGPLSVEGVRAKLGALHNGHLPYSDVYNRLVRLTSIGMVESYRLELGGEVGRWFWPAR